MEWTVKERQTMYDILNNTRVNELMMTSFLFWGELSLLRTIKCYFIINCHPSTGQYSP